MAPMEVRRTPGDPPVRTGFPIRSTDYKGNLIRPAQLYHRTWTSFESATHNLTEADGVLGWHRFRLFTRRPVFRDGPGPGVPSPPMAPSNHGRSLCCRDSPIPTRKFHRASGKGIKNLGTRQTAPVKASHSRSKTVVFLRYTTSPAISPSPLSRHWGGQFLDIEDHQKRPGMGHIPLSPHGQRKVPFQCRRARNRRRYPRDEKQYDSLVQLRCFSTLRRRAVPNCLGNRSCTARDEPVSSALSLATMKISGEIAQKRDAVEVRPPLLLRIEPCRSPRSRSLMRVFSRLMMIHQTLLSASKRWNTEIDYESHPRSRDH